MVVAVPPRQPASRFSRRSATAALISPLSDGWQPSDLMWRLGLVGVGMGLFAGPNMAVAMQQAPGHLLGTAGAATSLARSLAFALGPAVATVQWALAGYSIAGMRTAAGLTVAVAALAFAATVAAWVRRRAAPVEVELERAA